METLNYGDFIMESNKQLERKQYCQNNPDECIGTCLVCYNETNDIDLLNAMQSIEEIFNLIAENNILFKLQDLFVASEALINSLRLSEKDFICNEEDIDAKKRKVTYICDSILHDSAEIIEKIESIKKDTENIR